MLDTATLGGPAPIENSPMSWDATWTLLMNAELRFSSAQWTVDRCIVVFRRSRSNVRLFALTEGERFVFEKILGGLQLKDIALEKDLASSRVAACLKSAMLKLGFRTRLDAAPIAALLMSHRALTEATGEGADRPKRDPSRRVFSVSQGEFVVASSPGPNWKRFPETTKSEREIAIAILAGKTNAEVAAARGTSAHTVESQVANLFRKMHASGRFDLLKILYA